MKNQTKRSDLQLIYSAKEKKRQLIHIGSASVGVLSFLVLAIAFGEMFLLLLAFTALVTLHRETIHSDETAVSGSIVVICAAIIGWSESAAYIPIVCAVFSALHWEHIRDHQIKKLLVNMFATVAATSFAIIVFKIFDSNAFTVSGVIVAVIVVVTYWCINNVIISVAISWSNGSSLLVTVKDLVRSDLTMLWFGFAGALCGLVMLEVNPEVGILALLAVLVVLDVFVISMPVGLAALRQNWLLLFVRATATVVAAGVGLIVVNAIGVSALGISIGLLAASFAALAIVTLAITVRLWFSPHAQGRPDPTLIGGIVLVEAGIPLLGGALGVLGAVAGVAAVIVAAAIAAIMISLGVAGLRRKPQPEPIDSEEVLGAVMLAMFDGLPDLSQHH